MQSEASTWGLERRQGRLVLDGCDLSGLAARYGTPLHVVSARRLRERCARFRRAFSSYPSPVAMHFSYKTNSVARVLEVMHGAGFGAEVVSGYELWLAERLGVSPDRIVFNGPNKRDEELKRAVELGIGLLVVDGLDELSRVQRIARRAARKVRIALRICPNIAPRSMNASSLTGSRKNQFGLDLLGGEADEALGRALQSTELTVRGVMAHVGSGIHDVTAFERMVSVLLDFYRAIGARGGTPELIDIGGGLGARASREFTTLEMLAYLGLGRMPSRARIAPEDFVERYASAVTHAVTRECARRGMAVPALVLEPGRAITSDAQVLLLTVGAVRSRPGVGRFALADGGAMSVSMMFLSELHAVLLANREAPPKGRTSIFGALPSPMDLVYRNLACPMLEPGDVLCVADAGAYFTATATNFGGPRPAVVLIDDEKPSVVRRRESFEDLVRNEIVDFAPRAAEACP